MNSQARKDSPADRGASASEPGAADPVYTWRLEQLRRAGYADSHARQLAASGEVDLHVACDLVARGCPETTAFSILA